jgi:hypothetical protein
MPGLVPGIHVFARAQINKDVDGRTSPAMTWHAALPCPPILV